MKKAKKKVMKKPEKKQKKTKKPQKRIIFHTQCCQYCVSFSLRGFQKGR